MKIVPEEQMLPDERLKIVTEDDILLDSGCEIEKRRNDGSSPKRTPWGLGLCTTVVEYLWGGI